MILDKKIQIFLTIAEAGSFSRTARKLSLSQSVISFHMDSLEKELGIRLFNREGRTISLTSEGTILYRDGLKLAQAARKLQSDITHESTNIAQRIFIGGDALSCAFTFPWTLAAYREKHPEVSFSYRHMDKDDLLEGLLDGSIDIALSGLPVKHRKLEIKECFEDEIILAAAAANEKGILAVDELATIPLIWISSDRGLDYTIEKGLSKAGLATKNLNILMEIENLSMAKTLLRAGVGMAFAPKLTVQDELDHNLLREVYVQGVNLIRKNRLIYRKTRQTREAVTQFIEFVQQSLWVHG